jgi:hypothetical protein
MRSKFIPTAFAMVALCVSTTAAHAGGIGKKDAGAAIFGAAVASIITAAVIAANQKDTKQEKVADHDGRNDRGERRAHYRDSYKRYKDPGLHHYERRARYAERQARHYERQARYFNRKARYAEEHSRHFH